MKEKILQLVVSRVITSFLGSLSGPELKKHLDNMIDVMEDRIAESPNQFDDTLLPVIKFARDLFDIPDLPDKK